MLEELVVLLLCLAPWFLLPIIAYYDGSQIIEVLLTNTGFLLLMGLHVRNNIRQLRADYQQLKQSEQKLLSFNESLQKEVERRTLQLENLSRAEKFTIRCEQYNLTNREKEIALLVVTGNTYKQIAAQLYIAERTVAKHMQNIFVKINVSNKTELSHKLGG